MENRTPKSVLLTWVVILTLFLLSLFALGEPAPRSTTAPITAAFSENDALAATATLPPNAILNRNYFITHSPTLTWSRVAWATGYELQVSISPNFSALINIPNPLPADKLYYTAIALPDGEYYWRVRALDAKSKPGEWSKLEHITVYTVTPTITITPQPTITETLFPIPTLTHTPSYTPSPSRSPTPPPAPTFTPSPPGPFDCSKLIADNVSLSGSSVFASIHNQNRDSTFIQRVVFQWPSIPQYTNMYLSEMALDNYPHWQGISASAPYPAETTTDTNNDSYITTVAEIDRTVAGQSTGHWTATFSLAPTNMDYYVSPGLYAALFYMYDPLHPSTPCVVNLIVPPPIIPTMTYTPSYTLTLSRTPTTTRTPTLGSFPTNPPAPPTSTPTAGGSSGGSPQPPPTLPGGGCVDNCG